MNSPDQFWKQVERHYLPNTNSFHEDQAVLDDIMGWPILQPSTYDTPRITIATATLAFKNLDPGMDKSFE